MRTASSSQKFSPSTLLLLFKSKQCFGYLGFFNISLMSEPCIYKYSVDGLTLPAHEEELKAILQRLDGVEQIDTNLTKQLVRIISIHPLEYREIQNAMHASGFRLQPVDTTPSSPEQKTLTVCIDGMTCRSCELTVERKWKKLSGVKKVNVNAATGRAELTLEGTAPSISQLQTSLADDKYRVHQNMKKAVKAERELAVATRPSFWRLVALFAFVLLIGRIVSSLGLLKTSFSVGSGMSFGAIFVIGLVAASSSCIAITGGLLLSAAAKFNERYVSAKPLARMRPVALFVIGRIVSYTILGGLLGVVGAAFSPSTTVTAIIAIIAAGYMLIMGLDMLHIAPAWLKGLMPRMPKSLSHRIMDAEGKEHPLAPLGLGAATFFLPCGFTQALQLYALTTGSFTTGAITLLAFALGTAPALLALGWASSSLRGKVGRLFFQFSGALVVVLGLWNIQNGLSILGYPLTLPSFGDTSVAATSNESGSATLSGTMEGNTQVIKMGFGGRGYSPDHFTLRAGVPVRWEVDGTGAGGCTSVLVSRQLGVQKFISPGINTIAFTPSAPGEVSFSCSMGMVRGSFTVLSPA